MDEMTARLLWASVAAVVWLLGYPILWALERHKRGE